MTARIPLFRVPLVRASFSVLAFGLAASLVMTGCGHKSSTVSQTRASNIFRYPIKTSPTTFDPAMVQDGDTIDVLQQVFEGLVQWSPQNKIVPCLAEKWDVSPNGLTYTFHLRPNVKFQDGSSVTASDVLYSMRRCLDPKLGSPVALNYLGDIQGAKELNSGKATELTGVKVVNPTTVAITITRPKAYWIDTMTYPTAYVVSQAEAKIGVQMTADDVIKGAGTGAFKLTSYVPDSKVTLAANPAYWDGAPKLAGIERPVIIDAGTRHDEYVRGDIDMLQFVSPGDLDNDAKDPALSGQVKLFPRAATYYIGLNQKAFPAFKDIRVRQALAYAIDKTKIVQVVFAGKRDVAQDILSEGIPGFDPKFQGLPYDPAKAKALLAAAGHANGAGIGPIPLYYRQGQPELVKTALLIQQMWSDTLGLQVKPQVTEWGALLDRENKNSLECYHMRWAADYLDPQDFYSLLLRTGGPENHVVYSNPKFDALCDAADISQNSTQRTALYRQAARIVADEVPIIPLYYQQDVELIKPYVSGLDDGLMGHLPYKHLTLSH
ncbi:MAG: peptide ABC transporter substrate-binding protein [Janthinobacterium lividum]